MSTLGPVRIIRIGQSKQIQTHTRAVTDPKYSPLLDVPAFVVFRTLVATSDLRVKTTPNAPYQVNQSYPITAELLTLSRDWAAIGLVTAWSLRNMGHAPHVFQYAEGASSLALDWSPSGTGADCYGLFTQRYLQYVAAASTPADPGISRTVLSVMNGEADAADPTNAANFKANWDAFYTAVTSALSLPNLKFVMSRVSPTQDSAAHADVVAAQQDLIATAYGARCVLLNTDDLARSDGAHLTPAAAETYGLREATAFDGLLP